MFLYKLDLYFDLHIIPFGNLFWFRIEKLKLNKSVYLTTCSYFSL